MKRSLMAVVSAVLLSVVPTIADSQVNRVPDRYNADNVKAEVTDSTTFYVGNHPSFGPLAIDLVIAPNRLAKLVPFASGRYAVADVDCRRIKPDRHLSGCKIDVEPSHRGYERAAEEIIKSVKVSVGFNRPVGRQIESVFVQLRMSNSDVQAMDGPCRPPTCTPTPPPPPPPPPPPKK